MDAVNEKRVFNLLVKMTGRPGSSQYFLLTPKVSITTITIHHCVLIFINLALTASAWLIVCRDCDGTLCL